MNSLPLFTAALGLQAPWQITEAKFEEQENGDRSLHLWIDFERGAKFSHGDEEQLTAYDTVERQWRCSLPKSRSHSLVEKPEAIGSRQTDPSLRYGDPADDTFAALRGPSR